MLILLVVNFNLLLGCSCDWNGGLVKNAQTNTLTIQGKVHKLKTYTMINDYPKITSIEVEILVTLKGEDDRKFIIVRGDRCRRYLSNFQVGSEWIFSLQRMENGEYTVSICGENITPVEKNKTKGYILYNDKCSIEEPINISIDSLILAIKNPEDFMFPAKSCFEGESKYFIEANEQPKISKEENVIEYLKEELNIKKDIRKRNEDKIMLELFVDEVGTIEKITYAENELNSKKMINKYGNRIIDLLQASSPWIPAKHRGQAIPMKFRVELTIETLIKKEDEI